MNNLKCRHFGICGGCKYQHISYEEQLVHKENFVQKCFDLPVQTILPSDPFWHYRNKMEFSFSQSRKGEKFLGLMKARGRVENIEECYLPHPWFVEILNNVRSWWLKTALDAYYPPNNQGLLRTLTLRYGVRTEEKMVILTISESDFNERDLSSFIESVGAIDALILRRQIVKKKTPTRFEEIILSGKNCIHELLQEESGNFLKFRIRGGSFFQPNSLQAEKLYQKAIEMADLRGNEEVLDLYCGTGTLGIFAASKAAHVLGIEIVPEAVEDAHVNLEMNAISNMKVLQGDVGEQLAALLPFNGIVFVDPPRVGLGIKAINELLALNPKKIVYISCNPQSQALDCAALLNYDIVQLQPVDQFPQTVHIENIALLGRKT